MPDLEAACLDFMVDVREGAILYNEVTTLATLCTLKERYMICL